MRGCSTLLTLSLIFAIAGCSKPEPVTRLPRNPQPLNTPDDQGPAHVIDACSLLTSKEIETIQGAPLKETKPSSLTEAGVTVSQCYFLLPTAADSIVLTVTQKIDKPDVRDPKQWWEDIFHRDEGGLETGEAEEHKPPEKITGLGDDAFWVPQGLGGALYALKANIYIRISIGGPANSADKIQKSKALAEIVLRRL